MGDLRKTVEARVIDPIFRGLASPPHDTSLPDVVLENRLRRARMRLLDALVSRGSADLPPDKEEKVRSLARKWAGASFDDGFREIEEFEIESARERDLVAALESGDAERIRAEHERRLRQHVVEELGRIEIRGIQTAHRVLQNLEEVYVPLHLEEVELPSPQRPKILRRLSSGPWTVSEALRAYRRILVVGAPGSGKSTLVAYLATRAAVGQLAGELGVSKALLPLVLAARSLSGATLTPQTLAEYLDTDKDLVEKSLIRCGAILFLDGLDEAPEQLRGDLISSLKEFAERYPEVRIIATSRPEGGPGEIQRRLSGLEPFRLAELTQREVQDFIDKWCLAAETSVRRDRSAAEMEARRAADDLKSRVARSRSVQQIAVNPLLASILCVVHRFLGHTIPERRVTLYEKCTDALLYEWDRTKFHDGAAIGRLDAEAKRRLLMDVAFDLHKAHAAEIDQVSVVRHFARALPSLGRPADEAKQMVAEIRDRSGLLVERRPGFFALSHLSFQEYLTALRFVRGGIDDKGLRSLIDRWKDPWWHEVIVLAAGVPGSNSGRIVGDLLDKGERGAVILAARCVETAVEMPASVREQVEKELEKLLPPQDPESADELGRLGKVVAPLLIKSLSQTTGAQKTYILEALSETGYSPAIPAIAQCVSDNSVVDVSYVYDDHGESFILLTIGEIATYILAKWALTVDTAKLTFREALRKPHRPEFLKFLVDWVSPSDRPFPYYHDVKRTIEEALREARRGKRRPRHGVSTD